VSDEARFLEALPVIDDVTGYVCRRHHLNATESDEFRSDVRMHFIDRNYEVLRQFEGRCELSTYLNIVVQRVFCDWRNRNWGRWRPSTEAKRLGPTAILIERLVTRDGWPLDQAIETLRVNHQTVLDEAHNAFCDTLSARAPRRMVSDEVVTDIPSPGPTAEDNIVKAERGFLAKRVQTALERALQELPPTGRLIVKMRFEDRAAVSDIARALHLEQRPLYRTLEQLLVTVRKAMEAEGISRDDIKTLFSAPANDWNDEGLTSAMSAAGKPDKGPLFPGNASGREERKKGASWLRNR